MTPRIRIVIEVRVGKREKTVRYILMKELIKIISFLVEFQAGHCIQIYNL